MTELELIIDFHASADRQGPGSEADTLKALGFLNVKDDPSLKVADIGCGSGGQTLTLARHLNGSITAVDLFPEFLHQLNEKARQSGLSDKIKTLTGSMDALPFNDQELDLIWSEGAIYNMGFENGIQNWKRFLKIGGYLAVSEITWLTPSRPEEINTFWSGEYPEIDTAAHKIMVLERNGFILEGYFYLSENSWIEHYYKPMETRFETFLNQHNHSELAQKVVSDYQAEIDLYQKYKDYYSYGFYLGKRVE